jgi:streptomycin 6-kinase
MDSNVKPQPSWHFQGFGVVEILSENNGLLLLECAVPGISLKSYFPEKDDEAINITANVIKAIAQSADTKHHPFPHIKDWLAALDKRPKNSSKTLYKKPEKLRDQLLKTAEPDVLLHGDLHHDNILQNGDDWLSDRSQRRNWRISL